MHVLIYDFRRWLASKRIPHWLFGAYILAYVQRVIGYRFDDIAPCHTIARVACPVLLVHGLEDDTVPVEEPRQIYTARSNEAVELLLVPGSHDDYGDVTRQVGELAAFLNRPLSPGNVDEKKAGDKLPPKRSLPKITEAGGKQLSRGP